MVAICLAGESDVKELAGLYRQLSKNYGGDERAILAALKHRDTDIYVASEDGRVVGTATVSFRAVPSFGLVAHVDDVVVDEDCRGRGVGRELMKHIEKRARRRGCKIIELTSRPSREEANRLYGRLGYRLRETNPYFLDLREE